MGKIEDAVKSFNRAAGLNANSVDTYSNIGIILSPEGKRHASSAHANQNNIYDCLLFAFTHIHESENSIFFTIIFVINHYNKEFNVLNSYT